MKKKFLCLLLVLMLLPIASIFVACKDKSYNLNNLLTDFNSIESENTNIKKVNGKFVFDYSTHANLNSVINTHYPYTEIEYYNEVYENLMAFSFSYIDECSNNVAVKDKSIKNQVKQDLDDLKKSIYHVDTYVNMLAEIINVSYNDDIFTTACLARLENLFIAYDELYRSAIKFNNTLSNLYFNNILSNSNPNIALIDSAEFESTIVVNNLDARLKWQMSNLSACFIEMYIDGGNLAKEIVNAEDYFDIEAYNYKDNINSIKVAFNTQTAAEKANNTTNKQNFYNLAIQAYNIQSALNNENIKFVHACNDIAFAGLNLDEANANEKMCANIVESQNELLSQYNNVLTKMLQITNG